MVPQLVAQLPELCLALVLQAEPECLGGDVVVEPLHPCVGPQELQALTVGLPQELDPRHQNRSVTSVLGSFSRYSRQHDHLRGSNVLQIINLNTVGALLSGGLC